MIDIAYIVSHGFASRMVTQTNLLGKLVQSGKKVALISPDKEDDNLKIYCKENEVGLYEFNPSSNFWTNQYSESRKYFLEDIDLNVALKEKHVWSLKYNTSVNPWNHLRPRVLYLVFKLIKKFPVIRKWYKSKEQRHLIANDAQFRVNNLNPKFLISTYPVSFNEAMLLKAGNNNLTTTTVIHLLSWDNITCKGHFPELSKRYIAWGSIMKDEIMDYYRISSERIAICGVPHFDVHYESRSKPDFKKYLIQLGLNPEKPYLFFGMSSPRFAPKEIEIVEQLILAINNGQFGDDMQMVIRPHPQNVQGYMADLSWLPRLIKLQSNRIGVDNPLLKKSKMQWSMEQEDMIKLSQLLVHSKICINSGSTLCIEALSCNIPVIVTAFDGDENLEYWKSARRLLDFPHLKKLKDLGGYLVVYSFENLFKEISNFISNPNKEIEKRNTALFKETSANTGIATSTVVRYFLQD
ncbi:MAG TPA: hypothetical protein PK622_02020 [Saprospiraceae bacterium]|nr:hypothetical protein [Saprospiraceae bacterium]